MNCIVSIEMIGTKSKASILLQQNRRISEHPCTLPKGATHLLIIDESRQGFPIMSKLVHQSRQDPVGPC